MSRISFLILFLIAISINFAKAQGGRPSGQRPSESQKIGVLSGKIVDADTGFPMDFTTVSLFSKKDSSLVTGGLTNDKGEFSVPDIPLGVYRVKISFIGYRDAVRDTLRIASTKPEVNLGTVKIRPAAQALDEVVVSGEKPLFENAIDRRVFNVEKNLVALGGSATDVLETIPSIAVDQDGGISLRGSGSILVLIDGKPSSLTGADRGAILEQIPASAIERIEVVTNPSAKYDAEGVGGIINIILKKNKLEGINGLATVSAGTRDKYNASLNVNYRTGAWNLFGGYSFRLNNNLFWRDQELTSSFLRIQDSDGLRNGMNNLGRLGADYAINDRSTLGFAATYSLDQGEDYDDSWQRDYNTSGELTSTRLNRSDEDESGYNYDLSANYRLTFDQPGREFTALVSNSFNDEDQHELYKQSSLDTEGLVLGNPDLRQNNNGRSNNLYVIQADYVHPFKDNKQKLEVGYKTTLRKIDTDQLFENFNYNSGNYEYNDTLSNHFIFTEQVHALYGIYSNQLGKFGYQAGLRYEQTLTNADQVTSSQVYENNYPGLFPSVFLSYKIAEENQLQLNYSRRVSRPNIRNLNPFVDASNPQSISYGNPYLQPEYTNSIEMSYLKGWKKVFLTSSVYYRSTNDAVQRLTIFNAEDSIQESTFANITQRASYGFEFINRYSPSNNFNTTLTYNFFRTEIEGIDSLNIRSSSNLSWSVNLMSNITIPKWFDIQLMGSYRAPVVSAQGKSLSMYFVNMGLKRDVLKKNGTISLNVSDLFDTRAFRINSFGEGFENEARFKRESRVATLTFTYKIGRFVEKRNRNGRGEGQGGGDEDFF